REELRELIACYAHRIPRGISAADLFTEDGGFTLSIPGQPVQEVRGRKAIEAMYDAVRPEDDHPMPMIHNIQLAIDGDEATGLCSNELRVASAGQSIIASGYYEDRFRRENGQWKFVQRDATFFHWVPIQQGWATPA
ncbi:MAG: nuclear transport factor 2 family protein, partial [Sphingomonadales bacterium]